MKSIYERVEKPYRYRAGLFNTDTDKSDIQAEASRITCYIPISLAPFFHAHVLKAPNHGLSPIIMQLPINNRSSLVVAQLAPRSASKMIRSTTRTSKPDHIQRIQQADLLGSLHAICPLVIIHWRYGYMNSNNDQSRPSPPVSSSTIMSPHPPDPFVDWPSSSRPCLKLCLEGSSVTPNTTHESPDTYRPSRW